jgi:hypothetical protein
MPGTDNGNVRHMTELFSEEPRDARRPGLWARRTGVALLAVLVVAALLNVVGQEPSSSRAAAPGATLRVSAPEVVRGGVLAQGRIEVRAARDLRAPQLVLARGWFEGMQVNTIEPAATDEASGAGGRVVLTYPALRAGEAMTVWVQLQVDPNSPGRRPLDVVLRDGGEDVAALRRPITILP